MKIRSDFVSNSSSSSYIIAIDFSKYDFDMFVEKVCDRCSGAKRADKRRSYAVDVRRTNEAVLRHGLMSECLYIGNPIVGRIRDTWKRGEGYDHRMIKPGDSDEYTPFRELLDGWRTLPPGEKVSCIDENTLLHEYDDELPAWIAVPREVMAESIRKPDVFFTTDESLLGNSPSARVKRIIAYVKQKQAEKIHRPETSVFCITDNTVKNTRDLMRAGYRIKFKSPIAMSSELMSKFLDEIEARIKDGETFIFAVAGDPGEGRDDNRLYMPDGHSYPFDGTPAQDVTGKFIEY